MLIYKIASEQEWREAERVGVYMGSAADHGDGFIHFSTAAQAEATAAKWFSGRAGLVLAAIETERLGAALRWEASRSDQLFPHLYEPLPMSAVQWARPLALLADGRHDFSALAQ